jgi:hypothetical protein
MPFLNAWFVIHRFDWIKRKIKNSRQTFELRVDTFLQFLGMEDKGYLNCWKDCLAGNFLDSTCRSSCQKYNFRPSSRNRTCSPVIPVKHSKRFLNYNCLRTRLVELKRVFLTVTRFALSCTLMKETSLL